MSSFLYPSHIPEMSISPVFSKLEHLVDAKARSILSRYFSENNVDVRAVKPRQSKLGDFRHFRHENHSVITVNNNMSKDAFLFILAHETAHYVCFRQYSGRNRPHSEKWQTVFSEILSNLLESSCFSEEIANAVASYSKAPTATVRRSSSLFPFLFPESIEEKRSLRLKDLEPGSSFKIANKKPVFIKGERRKIRFICKRLDNRRLYLISPDVRVITLE